MLFNSYEFSLGFLPICLIGFVVLVRRSRPTAAIWWLIAASLFFYAWWNPDPGRTWSPNHLLLLLGSIAFNYAIGTRIVSAAGQGRPRTMRAALVVGLLANLGTLGYFKYAGFLVTSANAALGTHFFLGPIALPLAISFFTFTQIAYLVDAYRGAIEKSEFRSYLLFVTLFPHLIAGPIVMYRNLLPQFRDRGTWRWQSENFAVGISLFAFGLFKKVALADRLAPIARSVFDSLPTDSPGFFPAWLGAVTYALQLYFDFSGYSDMAIGLGCMFNIRFPLNFDSPYKATTISDFWRRWHMTLSAFLRDYLYIPLGGGRVSESRRAFNVLVTMLLGGLWHGAGWTFVAWGGLHGCYLVLHRAWKRATQGMRWSERRATVLAGWALTQFAVVVGWVFFRAHSLRDAASLVTGMFGLHGLALPLELKKLGVISSYIVGVSFAPLPCRAIDLVLVAVALAIVLLAPNTGQIFSLDPRKAGAGACVRWSPNRRWALGIAVVLVAAMSQLSEVTEFIYFQF